MKAKVEVARELARAHFRVEPDLKRVFLLEGDDEVSPREPIKLLEVVEGTFETGFEAVAFAPNSASGIPYASVIVEISPREYSQIQDRSVRVNQHTWHVGREFHAE